MPGGLTWHDAGTSVCPDGYTDASSVCYGNPSDPYILVGPPIVPGYFWIVFANPSHWWPKLQPYLSPAQTVGSIKNAVYDNIVYNNAQDPNWVYNGSHGASWEVAFWLNDAGVQKALCYRFYYWPTDNPLQLPQGVLYVGTIFSPYNPPTCPVAGVPTH